MERESTGVLIVDDQADVVEVYDMSLPDEYAVRKAYDGDEALSALDDDVDVVVLDRRMPGLSGEEVLSRIRERDLDVRVAMVTAVDPDFDILEMSFDAYVTKPVDEDELRTVVAELADLSAVDADLRELLSLARRKTVLESEKPRAELEANEEYARLSEREAALRSRLTETIEAGDSALFERIVKGVSR